MTEHRTHADGSEHGPDCHNAEARLYEYLDGELDEVTMEGIAEHLQRCSPCLEAFDFNTINIIKKSIVKAVSNSDSHNRYHK